MNERIQLLADEAGLRFTQLMSNPMVPVVDGKETDLEKFAQLIVEECMSVCIDDIADPRDTVELKCAKKIKEHFGVE